VALGVADRRIMMPHVSMDLAHDQAHALHPTDGKRMARGQVGDPVYSGSVAHHAGGSGVPHLRITADIFDQSLVEEMDALTRVDRALYLSALSQFFCEIKALERQLGQRLLCDSTVEAVQPELAYMVPDLVGMLQNGTHDQAQGCEHNHIR